MLQKSFKTSSNQEILILILIIAIAILVRFWDLGWNGFNGDESIYSGQAASLTGDQEYLENFFVFRAHPLLLQTLVSLSFAVFGISDIVARFIPSIFSVLTVFVTYLLAKMIFSKAIGYVSTIILSLLPFHVFLGRQVLLDVPLMFFTLLTVYFICIYQKRTNTSFPYWIGITSGLAFISKEVGIFNLVIFFIYSGIYKKLSTKSILFVIFGFLLVIAPFLLFTLTREDAQKSIQAYSGYQLSRDPNRDLGFYFENLVNESLGVVLIISCILSLIYYLGMDKTKKYRNNVLLLLVSITIPFLFYQFIPTKGDRFLLPIIPLTVILGSGILLPLLSKLTLKKTIIICISFIFAVLVSNNFVLSQIFSIEKMPVSDHMGTIFARESAIWIKNNTEKNSTILTNNNRIADIVKFYSAREAHSLKYNPNPAYSEIEHGGLFILNNNINYILFDLTDIYYKVNPEVLESKLSQEMLRYIDHFNASLVHTSYTDFIHENKKQQMPAIKIYKIPNLILDLN